MTRNGVSTPARGPERTGGGWKTVFRKFVPAPWRRRLRLALREAPVRALDLMADFRETLIRPRFPLPPARLRRRVGGTSGRPAFERIGLSAAEEIRRALERTGLDAGRLERWLDFGCGSGRMARHVAAWPFVRELWGVDVDGEAIDWMRRHCPGHWSSIAPSPPTALASEFFDAAYAISVFTHLDERAGNAWLAEIHRVLKPGGLLIASTSAPDTSWARPDMSDAERDRLLRDGFLFLPGTGLDFNDESAFHSNAYLVRTWGRIFGQVAFIGRGFGGFQDLTIWRKWD